MLNRNSLLVLVLGLSIVGAWQALLFYNQDISDKVDLSGLDSQAQRAKLDSDLLLSENVAANSAADIAWVDRVAIELETHLANKQWRLAVASIDRAYSTANQEDLNRFRAIVFRHVGLLKNDASWRSASSLLQNYAEAFDDLEAWRQLGYVAAEQADWDTAITALLASSAQENDPQDYDASLRALVRASNHARTSLERSDDRLGILNLYQRLHNQHPNYLRFQFELAQAYLRINDPPSAKPYLEALRYDPQFGALALQLLETIDSSQASATSVSPDPPPSAQQRQNTEDILVPLVRSGGSMLIDVSIDSVPTRLLLDTGASITALSEETILRLALPPLNRSISLNTANGVVRSPLFRAKELKLGSLRINNLIIAQVDLGRNARFDGLLGTDALNSTKNQFSYTIDDQQMAVIFRKK